MQIVADRQLVAGAGLPHSRKRADALQHGIEEGGLLLRRRVLLGRERNLHRHNALRIVSQPGRAQPQEALGHKPCGHQQDQRQGDLAHHKRSPQPLVYRSRCHTRSTL